MHITKLKWNHPENLTKKLISLLKVKILCQISRYQNKKQNLHIFVDKFFFGNDNLIMNDVIWGLIHQVRFFGKI